MEEEPLVNRPWTATLEVGLSSLLDSYCTKMQKKRRDVVREAMREYAENRGIINPYDNGWYSD